MKPALIFLFSLLVGCSGDGSRPSGPCGRTSDPIVVQETPTQISISTAKGDAEVRVQKSPFRLEYTGTDGPQVTEAQKGMFFSGSGGRSYLEEVVNLTTRHDHAVLSVISPAGTALLEVSFPRGGVARLELTPPESARATSAGERLSSPPEEAIYGLIERTVWNPILSEFLPQEMGSLDRRGTRLPMLMLPSVALYTPFFQSSRGYGIFVEGSAIGLYDLAASDPEVIEFEFNLPPGVRSFCYLFLNGPTHDQILERYTGITGRPFLPPEWAFRHWRWRDEHRSGEPAELDGTMMNADLVDDVVHYEELGIPVGNYTFDRPWGTGDLDDLREPEQPGFGDLIWDEARFPNPQEMIDALNRRGYRVFLWVAPWATGKMTHREATELGYLAPGSRHIVDFTNPLAVEWWAGKITPLIEMGIAGLKLDRGDEDTPSLPREVYSDGRTGLEVRNAYPEIYARVHHDIVKRIRGNDFLVYPRAGYAGSQQWAIFSAGDIPGRDALGRATDLGLRSAILALQHCAFMGFPIWGSDTGGYEQFGEREVFARWIEFSAFCPIMEIGGVGTHAPWDMPTVPHFDEEMIEIYRRYVTMHHALLAYTYRHAREANRSGRPIAKALVFNYAGDPRVKDLWEEFLYGDDILVAPVWRVGQRRQRVYLPAGDWVDYWDDARVFTGPMDLDESAPLDRIPVFVREGAEVLGTF